MLHPSVAEVALRMDLLVQRQTATAHRQRGAQQVQRLVLLLIAPIDDDQRLGHTREQHPRQRRIDRLGIAAQMAIAQQPIGALNAMAQVRAAAEASADLGQRQSRAAHRRGHGFKQDSHASTVDAGQQRRDTTTPTRYSVKGGSADGALKRLQRRREGGPAPIQLAEILEVSRVTIDVAASASRQDDHDTDLP